MNLHEMKYNDGARKDVKRLVEDLDLAKARLLAKVTRAKTLDLVAVLLSVSKVDKLHSISVCLKEASLTSLEKNML